MNDADKAMTVLVEAGADLNKPNEVTVMFVRVKVHSVRDRDVWVRLQVRVRVRVRIRLRIRICLRFDLRLWLLLWFELTLA